jgi:hypothetical protein
VQRYDRVRFERGRLALALAYRHQLPRFIERGVAVTLSFDIRDTDDNSEKTAAVPSTYALFKGGTEVLAAVAVTTLGPPATYALAAATTTDETLSALWQERLAFAIDGVIETFTRPVHMCRFVPRQTITDTDLLDRHTDLNSLRDADEADFSRQRDRAWVWVELQLIRKGRRPELILDDYELADIHALKTLGIIFSDFASSLHDARYSKLAGGDPAMGTKGYHEQAQDLMDSLAPRYDSDEDGAPDASDRVALSPVILINRPPVWQ